MSDTVQAAGGQAASSTPSSGVVSAPAASAGGAGGAPPAAPNSAPSSNSAQERLPASDASPQLDDGAPFDFGSIMSPSPDADQPVVTPPVKPATQEAAPPVPPAPATPPAAPAAQTAPPAAEGGTTPQAPAEGAQPGQQPTNLSAAEPGQLAEAMRREEAAIVQKLAEGPFALTPEEQTALEENALGAIPKLLAKAHVRAMQNVLQMFSQHVPAMINRHSDIMKKHAANEDKFYSRWTGLNKAQHGEVVTRLAVLYRKMNPNATLEQLVEDVGPMAAMQLKIAPMGAGGPSALAQNAGPGGARPPQPSPFQPVGSSTTGAISPGGVPDDPWGVLDPSNQG